MEFPVETAVLAALIRRGGDECILNLAPEHFANQKNARLFEVIKDFYTQGKEINVVTVGKKFGEIAYVVNVADAYDYLLGTKQELDEHVAMLKKEYAARKLRAILMKKLNDLKESDPLAVKAEILAELENIRCADEKEEGNNLKNVLFDTLEWIEEQWQKGKEDKIFKLHLPDLQEITGGLHNGEMTIVAGRPGTGKTALALDIVLNAAKRGKKTLFISREMSRIALGLRLFAASSGIDTGRLKAGKLKEEDFRALAKALGPLGELDVIIDTKSKHVSEIRVVAKEIQARDRLDLIAIDYLQLLQAEKRYDTREQEVAAISRNLKELANDLDIPILVLAQLNRNAEGKRPTNGDLRESGAIEQDADNIWLLYAPDESDVKDEMKHIYRKLRGRGARFIELIISKHRNGPVGSVYMGFLPSKMMFFNFPKGGTGDELDRAEQAS